VFGKRCMEGTSVRSVRGVGVREAVHGGDQCKKEWTFKMIHTD
jgi:hypothetical protein